MSGLKIENIPVFEFFGPQDEKRLSEKLRNHGVTEENGWILVAPAAASELKTWRLAGFGEVIKRLLSESSENILLVGDKRERDISEPLVKINSSRIHNLGGETTLPELACLVSKCSFLLANDSALMHLGYELDRPVVGVFGPTHHNKADHQRANFKIVRELVFCAPCEKPVCRFERQACFEDLKAEKVFEACREFLYAHKASV
jgi:heptosyltransferase-2